MVSSEQCKYCDRDIFVVGSDVDFEQTIWAHVGTGSVACRASDLLEVNTMVAGGPFRAAPEDG